MPAELLFHDCEIKRGKADDKGEIALVVRIQDVRIQTRKSRCQTLPRQWVGNYPVTGIYLPCVIGGLYVDPRAASTEESTPYEI